MMVTGRVEGSRRAAAVCVAGLASVALFVVLMLDGGVARAQTEEAQAESTAKYSLIPAGVNDPGHYLAKLVLREGEGLDYETQDT